MGAPQKRRRNRRSAVTLSVRGGASGRVYVLTSPPGRTGPPAWQPAATCHISNSFTKALFNVQ